jgi:outer membrane protein assembly factor BamB
MVTTPLIIDDYVYGVDSYGELRGLDARTGERLWMSPEMTAQARWSTAFLVRHGDRYLVNNDEGDLISAQFTPTGYVELSRTRLIEPTASSGTRTPHGRIAERIVNWSHPAYANGHIVHRNDEKIIRASLRVTDY